MRPANIALCDKVYVIVKDAGDATVARRFLRGEDVPSWLTIRAGSGSVRCDVYDDAPACGGTFLTTYVPRGNGWEEEDGRSRGE
jgi:hypothetical protein